MHSTVDLTSRAQAPSRGTGSAAAFAVVLPALVFMGVLWVGGRYGIGAETFTKDPAALTKTPPWLGLLSHLGILAWCVGASAAGLGAVVAGAGSNARRLLAVASALTAWLMFDDLLLLHESVLPLLTGLPQVAVYAAYAVAVLAFLGVFRRQLLALEWPLLLGALAFLGASVGIDAVEERLGIPAQSPVATLEDGFKLVGIVLWSTYFARAALRVIRSPPTANARA